MTTLNFALSRALAQNLYPGIPGHGARAPKPGDEIVLTRMDHDANVSPWLRVAEDRGLVVRWVDITEPECMLDLNSLEAALTERHEDRGDRPRLQRGRHDQPGCADRADGARRRGADIVDAVQSAPHIPIDVQAIGCDFLLCSSYKFYGPHQGILWGRYDLLESLPAYKVRPAHDEPPYRWETGTPAFELIAGSRRGGRLSGTVWAGRRRVVAYERELVAHLIEVLQALRRRADQRHHRPGALQSSACRRSSSATARYTPTADRRASGGRAYLRVGWQLLRGRDHAAAEQARRHGARRAWRITTRMTEIDRFEAAMRQL